MKNEQILQVKLSKLLFVIKGTKITGFVQDIREVHTP